MIIWDISTIKKSLAMLSPKKVYILKEHKQNKSERQNKYYWGVCNKIISEHLWYMPLEMHEIIKATFKVETTTVLNTKEFCNLMDLILIWASNEFWLYIQKPNEHELFKWIDKQ